MSALLALLLSTATLRAELAPLAPLVGHCWQSEPLPNGARDTHCFEPVFDGQHIRDRHEVVAPDGGTYRGETLWSWNTNEGNIGYVYWNSFGQVMRGSATAETGSISFDGGATVWRWCRDGGYTVEQSGRPPVRFTRR